MFGSCSVTELYIFQELRRNTQANNIFPVSFYLNFDNSFYNLFADNTFIDCFEINK